MRFLVVAIAAVAMVSSASAQVVTITRIADTTTIAPNGSPFTAFGLFPSMDGSTVAFQGTAGGVQGIYSGTGGAIGTLVAPNSPIPGGTGNFTSLNGNFRYDSGSVAFVGSGTAPTQSGVYVSNGATINRIADLNSPVPGGSGNFTSFSPFPSIHNGMVVFTGGGSGGQTGVYMTAPGSLGIVADLNTPAPGATGNFTGFGANPALNNSIVFRASSSLGANAGIYTRSAVGGSLAVVADTNTPKPSGGNFGSPFFEPATSGANVSFINGNGVYASLGGTLATIADTTTPSPNGTGNFTAITAYAPIDDNAIAFIGNTSTSKGVYLFSGGQLYTLVDNTSGTLDGKPLGTTPFFLGPDAISGNQVAFGVSFASGFGSGIYRATFMPVPEPSALALAGVGFLAMMRRVRRFRKRKSFRAET